MVFNSVAKFKIYNQTNHELKKEISNMKKILKHAIKTKKLKNSYFTVILVDNPYIKELNKNYRKIDKETDVISFALCDEKLENPEGTIMLGDIYISIDKAKEQSKEYGHTLTRELCFLSIHGLLHLLGYDHMKKEEEEIMLKEQELILNGKRFSSIQKK